MVKFYKNIINKYANVLPIFIFLLVYKANLPIVFSKVNQDDNQRLKVLFKSKSNNNEAGNYLNVDELKSIKIDKKLEKLKFNFIDSLSNKNYESSEYNIWNYDFIYNNYNQNVNKTLD